MASTLIFWPVIWMAFVTIYLYVLMSKRRVASVKAGTSKASDYKLIENEPTEVRQLTNAIRNQYETPILFYAACTIAYVTGQTHILMLVLAYSYAIVKTAHVYVHVTSNSLRQRRPVFIAAFAIIILMWVVLAAGLLIS